ncbi:hypothetical protein NDU88_007983 [Pleurodeles waltl]|uniref:Uncharacterized protein n=1 Tax=Pleurodeles waltl TaxID=8319 RepID=A0AAV7N5V2_PLEWA|nr:hypothetical protein NDU88_007983 [Pleurodeles waltl]
MCQTVASRAFEAWREVDCAKRVAPSAPRRNACSGLSLARALSDWSAAPLIVCACPHPGISLLFRSLLDHTRDWKSAMPGGWTSGKQSGKPSRQLLFSEAVQNSRAPSPASELQALTPPGIMTEPAQGATMDHILQEISEVGRRLEGMDNAIYSMMAETKSMRLDIFGFHSGVLGLEQWVSSVETHITSFTDRD